MEAPTSKGAIGDWEPPRVLVDTFTSDHHVYNIAHGDGRWVSPVNENTSSINASSINENTSSFGIENTSSVNGK